MGTKKLHLMFVCMILLATSSALMAADDDSLIIAPRGEKKVKVKKIDLPPPGTMMAESLCSLERDDEGWAVAVFEKLPGKSLSIRMRVLPCAWLEAMENIKPQAGRKIKFLVSGQVMVHEKQCYLLPVTAVSFEPALLPKKPTPEKHEKPEKVEIKSDPKDAPAAIKKDPTPKPEPKNTKLGVKKTPANNDDTHSPDDLIDDLFKDGKTIPILPEISDTKPPEQTPSTAPIKKSLQPASRSGIIDNRIAYIVPANSENSETTAWWKVVFVSDNTLQDGPVKVLPNRLLEKMQKPFKPGLCPRKLKISGMITKYRGQSYLLLRKALPARQMGQF